jgi:dipeptidyl aminopeptidase/acylaminoacyl peptidase
MNKLAICFAVLVAVSSSLFAQKRNITEKDLFDFVWIGDPQISPDGTRVAFVRVTVNEKKEGYNTSIWSVPVAGGEEPHQLTKGDHDSAPRWSPDGKYLLFLRATEKEGKPEPPHCPSSRWQGAIHLFLPICRKARATRCGHRMAKPSRSRVRQTQTISPNRKRKNARKRNSKEE